MKWSQLFKHNARSLFRQRQLSSIRLLFLSLIMAVMTVTVISLVSAMLKQSLTTSSTQFMAGDRQLVSPRKIDFAWLKHAERSGLKWSRSVEFSSMMFAKDKLQLIAVKAVDERYPLKGGLLVSDQSGNRIKADAGPVPESVWLQKRLFSLFDISRGEQVFIGDKAFTVSKELVQEPDAGFQLADLAPRVMIDFNEIEAMGVIQPGSRLTWRYYFAGSAVNIEAYEAWIKPQLAPSQHWQGVKEGRPAIADALDKTETYLLLGGSLAVLLACVAVAMSSRQFALAQIDNVAIMKSLGVTGNTVVQHFVIQLALLGLVASLIGLASGVGLANGIQRLLSSVIPELQAPAWSRDSARILILATGTALISLFGFALPQFLQLRNVSPMRVLRQEKLKALAWSWKATLFSVLAVFILLYAYGQNTTLVLSLMLAVVTVMLVLLFICWVFYLLIGRSLPEGMSAGSAVRQAINSLVRRRWHSLIQLNVFSLSLMLFSLIFLARETLIRDWQNQLPDDAPNHFLINVAVDQLERLQAELAALQISTTGLYPMVRGRLSHINSVPVKVAVTKDVAALNRELNLTWAERLPEDNKIEQGHWWPQSEHSGGSGVSVESLLAAKLGLELGDQLTFTIGGESLETRVTSIRSVQWDSMRPNFYMMFEPNRLAGMPTTYITSFYLPESEKSVLNKLGRLFPTITILELDQLIGKIRTIVAQVSRMIEMILVFIFLASMLVISALISTTMGERSKEAALMRTLGAKRNLIARSQFIEFFVLGWLAAWVAVLCSELVMWLVQRELFDAPFKLHYGLWLVMPLISAALIGLVSYLQIRHVPRTSPMVILRAY